MSTDTAAREIIDYPFGDYSRLAGVGDRVRILLYPIFDTVEGEIIEADENGLRLKIDDDFILPLRTDEIANLEVTKKGLRIT